MKFLRNILDKVEKNVTGDGKYKRLYPMYEMIDTFLFTPSSQTEKAPYVRDSIDLKRSMVFVVLALLPAFFLELIMLVTRIPLLADLKAIYLL